METIKKLLGLLNPTQNTTTADKAGTLGTIATVVATLIYVLSQSQVVLCALGVASACVKPAVQ